MSKLSAVSQDSARADLSAAGKCGSLRQLGVAKRLDLPDFIMGFTSLMPNKSPEPTAVAAAGAIHAASRRWLSFFR